MINRIIGTEYLLWNDDSSGPDSDPFPGRFYGVTP